MSAHPNGTDFQPNWGCALSLFILALVWVLVLKVVA